MSALPEYMLERIFDAPRELVWRAWTDSDLLHRWFGTILLQILIGRSSPAP